MIFTFFVSASTVYPSIASISENVTNAKSELDKINVTYLETEASNQAKEILDQIDGILAKSYQISPDSSSYFSEIEAMLSESDMDVNLNFSIEINSATLNYTTTVDDSQAQEVDLTLNDPWTTSSGFYTITSWKEVATNAWDADNSMKLIQ